MQPGNSDQNVLAVLVPGPYQFSVLMKLVPAPHGRRQVGAWRC